MRLVLFSHRSPTVSHSVCFFFPSTCLFFLPFSSSFPFPCVRHYKDDFPMGYTTASTYYLCFIPGLDNIKSQTLLFFSHLLHTPFGPHYLMHLTTCCLPLLWLKYHFIGLYPSCNETSSSYSYWVFFFVITIDYFFLLNLYLFNLF